MPGIELLPMPLEVPYWWARILDGLDPPEAAYGPECHAARPRPEDVYYCALLDPEAAAAMGRRDGDRMVGLAYTQRPAPTTRVFGLGLLREYRHRGFGPLLRDTILAHCFSEPEVAKVESQIYTSNAHSMGALHGKYARMREEGRQRETIVVRGRPYDRVLFGITRGEYEGLSVSVARLP